MTDEDDYVEPRGGAYRARPPAYALGGLVVGLILGVVIAALLGGNPLSSSNRVTYVEVTVGSIQDDRICWADDPTRRDADQTCAILALDPSIAMPSPGDRVTVGMVEVRTPTEEEFRQVIWAGGATTGDDATPAGTTPASPATPTPTETPS